MTDRDPRRPRQAGGTARRVWVSFAALALILGVAGALTLARRRSEFRALAAGTEEASIATVAVIHPTVASGGDELTLPAALQAFIESPIYARTTGYLEKWDHDIGSRVDAGEALAEIETPEIDQELLQARASRQQTAASLALARSTAARWADLRKTDSVSQQEADEKQSAYDQLQATLAAADANVRRLENLEAFKHVTAPFAGVIASRTVDVGTLVSAGTQQPLFRLVQTDPIRVYVSVPEADAAAMHAGLPAVIDVPQLPGETFEGAVVRTAGVIDAATRTLMTEVNVPNHGGRLLPGGYAQVRLHVGRDESRMQVPVNTLLFRAEGARAAVVDDGGRVHLRPITIGRDFGTTVEILQGLSATDWIVVNPPDSIDDGQNVTVQRPRPEAAAPARGAAR
jgi:RND family efflux transporter MFP subunit